MRRSRASWQRRIHSEGSLGLIENNAHARALYEHAGFVLTRRLVGFRAAPLATEIETSLDERRVEDVVRAYLREADPDLPWQLAPATMMAAAPPTRAFALDEAFALVDLAPAAVVVRALVVSREARREGRATRLLRALRARFPARALRIAPIVPQGLLGEVPARAGMELDPMAQLELVRDLVV